MMGDEGHLFFGGGFMWVFWLLVIAGVFFLIQNLAKGSSSRSSNEYDDSPLEILKKRYARGEIDEEEYERRRKKLES